MQLSAKLRYRLYWLKLPVSLLIVFLQRTPAVRLLVPAAELTLVSPMGNVLRSAFSAAVALGGLHTLAGATELATSLPSPVELTVGTGAAIGFAINGVPASPDSWTIGGSVPPGLTFPGGRTTGTIVGATLLLSGTPTTPGTYIITLRAFHSVGGFSPTYDYVMIVSGAGPPPVPAAITAHPSSLSVTEGSSATFSVSATGDPSPTYQWQVQPAGSGSFTNAGGGFSGTTTDTLTLTTSALANNGDQFRCVATNSAGSATSNAATLTVNPLVVNKTDQTISFGALADRLYTSAAIGLTATASSGLAVSYSVTSGAAFVSGGNLFLTGLGPVTVQAAQGGNATYNAAPNVPQGFNVTIAPATVTLSNLSATYHGSAQSPTVTTNPAGVSVGLTYDGSATAPVNAGSYAVIATVTNANYQGSSSGTFVITKANQTITFVDPATQVSGATSFALSATASSGLTILFTVLSGPASITGSTITLTGGGAVTVRATQPGDPNHNAASPVDRTFSVAAFTKFSAGRYHSLRLDAVPQLYATGTNTFGQLGTGNTTNLTTPQAVTISGQTIVDLAAGAEHSLFLTADRELWVTGKNSTGQLGDGTLVAKSTPIKIATNVVGVAGGFFHSAFLKSDGTLWTVGGNDSGQLGDGTTADRSTPMQIAADVVDLAAGTRQTFFIKSDGTLWGTGDMNGSGVPVSTPVQIATGVKTVAAGAYHSLFVKTDGTLWVLGYNIFGQLGTGNTTDALTPVQIATGVKTVASGYYHSLLVRTDGTLWGMGYNTAGQLGDGATANRLTPYQMATNVLTACGSENYTLFLKGDGTLWGTGDNTSGQFGNGGTTNSSTPVQLAARVGLGPEIPADLTATPSVALDRLHLTWQPTANATAYEVWRNTANDSSGATRLAAGVRWSVYQDLTAVNGPVYYYWIKSVNSSGTSQFSAPVAASFVSLTPPSLSTHPQTQTVNVGTNVTFSVTASGSATLTYQWRKGGANIGSATSTSYTLTGVTVGDAGNYDVVVTNGAGSVPSNAATLTVNKLGQTITFATLADRAYTTTPINLTASADSGLTVVLSVQSGPASLSGSDLTITGIGTVTVRAAQAGDATYNAAANVDRSFAVAKATATVTLGNLSATYNGSAKSATATTNPASLSVDFTYDATATAPTNAGSYAVVGTINEANYQGTANGTLVIAKADQTISFTGPANQAFTATPIALSATASSSLGVTFSVQSGPATVSGSNLTLTGAGSVTVRAAQSGDANRHAAPDVDQSFTVAANFNSWALSKFTAGELLDANISGPNAIFGQDGLPNLVKYALGLEPKQASTTGLPVVSTLGPDWVYTYTRSDNITDVTYTVEIATNLTAWTTVGVTHELVSNTGGVDTWRGRYPLGSATTIFFRLKVVQP